MSIAVRLAACASLLSFGCGRCESRPPPSARAPEHAPPQGPTGDDETPPPPEEAPDETAPGWGWLDPVEWPTAELTLSPRSAEAASFTLTAVRVAAQPATPAAVTLSDPRFRVTATDCLRVVQPGESCSVTVAYTPDDSLVRSAELTLVDAGADATHAVWAFVRVGQRLGSASGRRWLDAFARADGGFVAIGTALSWGPLALVRLAPELSLVDGFGEHGVAWIPRLVHDENVFCAIAPANDEALFVACLERVFEEGEARVTVRKIDAQGALDASFGDAGVARWPGLAPDETLQPCPPAFVSAAHDGARVLVGFCSALGAVERYHVVAFNPDGTPDDDSMNDTSAGSYFAHGDLAVDQPASRFIELRVDAAQRLYVSRGRTPDGAASVARFVGGALDLGFGGGDGVLSTPSASRYAVYQYLGADPAGLVIARGDGVDTGLVRFTAAGDGPLLDLPLSYWGHGLIASGGRSLLWADGLEASARALRLRALDAGGFDPDFAGPATQAYARPMSDVTFVVSNSASDRALVATGYSSDQLSSVTLPSLTALVASHRLVFPERTGSTSQLLASVSDTFAVSSRADVPIVQQLSIGADGRAVPSELVSGMGLLSVSRAQSGAHWLALTAPGSTTLQRVVDGAFVSGSAITVSAPRKVLAHGVCGDDDLYVVVREPNTTLTLAAYDAAGVVRASFTGGDALHSVTLGARAAAVACLGEDPWIAVAEADSSGCGLLRAFHVARSGESVAPSESGMLCNRNDGLRALPHPLGHWLITNDVSGPRALVIDAAGQVRLSAELSANVVHDAFALPSGELLLLTLHGGLVLLERFDVQGNARASRLMAAESNATWRFSVSGGVVRVVEIGLSGTLRMTALP